MKRLKRALVLTAFATLAAQPAVAQLPDTGDLTALGYTWTYNGVGVGPYTGAIPGHPTIDIYCVDFNHNASTSATPYNFNNFAEIEAGDTQTILDSETRWGYDGGDPLVSGENWENYQKAAYLTTFFQSIANDPLLSSSTKSEKIGQLHSAIWHLFNPGNPSSSAGWTTTTQDDPWFTIAENGYQAYFNANARYWYIATSTDTDTDSRGIWNEASGGKQEYLVHVTPEPTSIILLGTGLLGVGLVVRRRKLDTLEDAG